MQAPLLVTDPGLARLSIVETAVTNCRRAGLRIAVFDQISANPRGLEISAGVAAFRAGNHDGVIAFGGGSALDAGKAVALMVGQTGALWDYEDVGDNWRRVDEAQMAAVVAVPTTAGTGSEVGRASVITDKIHPGNASESFFIRPCSPTRHTRSAVDGGAAAVVSTEPPVWMPCRAQSGGSVRSRVSPHGRGYRNGGHKTGQGISAARRHRGY